MGLFRYANQSTGVVEKIREPLPAGLFLMVPRGGAVPEGTLLCDGSPYNRRRYPQLHRALAALGTDTNGYGADSPVNGTLPDFRGRSPVGVGTHADVATRGASEGLGVGSRSPRHTHTTVSHQHVNMTHDHTSTAHSHGTEPHAHTIDGHQHGVSTHSHGGQGTAAATSGKPGNTGGNTVADDTHQHGFGSYSLDAASTPATNLAFPGQSGSNQSASHPGGAIADTGAASPSNSQIAAGAAVQLPTTIGFAAVQWVVTTGRVRRGFLRRG